MIHRESTTLKEISTSVTEDGHYTKFFKTRGYNFMIYFKKKEHFNNRDKPLLPSLGEERHRSHLLSLHKLPHESTSQSDSQ